jgi:ATP-dependent helicase/nuclease subunit B
MHCTTIPAGVAFLETLARGLIHRTQDEAELLARTLVLLPTQRAVPALREAFVRVSEGRPLLLPRMAALGDIEQEGSLAAILEEIAPLPPAIPLLTRQFLLAQLIERWQGALPQAIRRHDHALLLADSLASLLDDWQRYDCDTSKLRDLAPEHLSHHWQEVVGFLSILTEHWPKIVQESGFLDPVDRRNRQLRALVAHWEAHPPAFPLVAAGSTGSQPATARLLRCIARMPEGMLVLPPLDQESDADYWKAIAPGHPQYALKNLLELLNLPREAVTLFPGASPLSPRTRWIAEVMRPAAVSEAWHQGSGLRIQDSERGTEKLLTPESRILNPVFPTPQDEALGIAMMLRETLETPGKTAMLVTPDRALARRVIASLARYGVELDDSAGVPVAALPSMVFLRLVVELAGDPLSPVPFLALLKHPMAVVGVTPAACRRMARRLEIHTLRGLRPHTLEGWRDVILTQSGAKRKDLSSRQTFGASGEMLRSAQHDEPEMRVWFDRIHAALEPLTRLLAARSVRLRDLWETHLRAAEALASSDVAPGAERLWAEDTGHASSRWCEALWDAAEEHFTLDGRHYAAVLQQLMSKESYHAPYHRHPRLRILSPIEARLQRADRVILAGLNEGTWPALPEADPWLSRPMRVKLGLPDTTEEIGRSAYDVATLMALPEVILTRARKQGGSPAIPSRWWQRVEVVGGLQSVECGVQDSDFPHPSLSHRERGSTAHFPAWVAQLDQPKTVTPLAPVAACPPVGLRPRSLSATRIELLLRDPYSLYASKILKLKALEELDLDPSHLQFGQILHAILEGYALAFPSLSPDARIAWMEQEAASQLGKLLERPAIRHFWWPRLMQILHWFVEEDAARRATGLQLFSECTGTWQWAASAGPFTLSAKADRLEYAPSTGELACIDYKTGLLPSQKKIDQGVACQLTLEALIAAKAGFADLPELPLSFTTSYWKLHGREDVVEYLTPKPEKHPTLIREAEAGVQALIAAFDDPETPYLSCPTPDRRPPHSDFMHLARVKEWGG